MRRGLAGILLCVGAVLLALAGSGWWLQRTALDPDASRAAAGRVYAEPDIQTALATLVSDYTTERVGVAADQMAQSFVAYLEPMLADPVVNRVLDDLAADAHAALIGTRREPVVLTGLDLVMLVRTEAVGDLEPLVVPVERSSTLSAIADVVRWLVPIAAGAGLLCVLLGLAARPGRANIVFAAGVLALVAAACSFTFVYVAPRFGTPLVTDGPWAATVPAVAEHVLTNVLIVAGALGVAGLVLVLVSYGIGSGTTKSWSTPVRTARYSDQPKWTR